MYYYLFYYYICIQLYFSVIFPVRFFVDIQMKRDSVAEPNHTTRAAFKQTTKTDLMLLPFFSPASVWIAARKRGGIWEFSAELGRGLRITSKHKSISLKIACKWVCAARYIWLMDCEYFIERRRQCDWVTALWSSTLCLTSPGLHFVREGWKVELFLCHVKKSAAVNCGTF